LCNEPIEIDDVETTSSAFDEMLLEVYPGQSPAELISSSFNALSKLLKISRETAGLSFRSIYDTLIELYMKPLPHDVPSEFRNRQLRCIRTIATEICLALVRLPETSVSQPSTREPTPKASHVPSSRVRFESRSGEKFTHEDVSRSPSPAPELNSNSLLSEYVKLSRPLPVSTSKTNMNLMHWTLGSDPSDYNYTAMRVLERQQEDLAQMSTEERRRVERQQLRRAREAEREAQRFEELSQKVGTQKGIAASQSELNAQNASQNKLRLALSKRRAEAAASQSQSQRLMQADTIDEEVTMAGAIPSDAVDEPEAHPAEPMDIEPSQDATQNQVPESQTQSTQPLDSQAADLQPPSFSQFSQQNEASQTQKPPKKKKRVKGF
jgi:RNA polymerase I-specific transcription-initiation factor